MRAVTCIIGSPARYPDHAEDITAPLDALYAYAMGDTIPAEPAAVPCGVRSRAQACLLGQLASDSLGSLVQFKAASTIRSLYPEGIREQADEWRVEHAHRSTDRRLRDGSRARPNVM